MSYQTRFRREALKELKRLPAHVRAEALEKIEGLAEEPWPARAKELRGKPGFFRLWVAASWRLVYRVDRGDGTYTKKRECTPKYRKEPVYDQKCRYKIDKWSLARTEVLLQPALEMFHIA